MSILINPEQAERERRRYSNKDFVAIGADVRQRAASTWKPATTPLGRRQKMLVQDPFLLLAARDARAAVDAKLESFARRRMAERTVAEWISQNVIAGPWDKRLGEVVEKMRWCREHGRYGLTPDGDAVMIWESKCSCSRLCPDEARTEGQRLAERYIPPLAQYARDGMRVHYGVFTMPNFERGQLKKGMKQIYARLKRVLRRPEFKNVTGYLAVLEAPLSVHGDWNVHLNVILVVDGWLDYGQLRRAWHWDVELKLLKGDAGALVNTFAELIKYGVQSVPDKAEEKQASGKSKAPALVEWPPEAFREWWDAMSSMRRTRSFGGHRREYYGDPDPNTGRRRYKLQALPGSLYPIPKPEPEVRDLDLVQWLGPINFDGKRYETEYYVEFERRPPLDSVPADRPRADKSTTRNGQVSHQATGPPAGGVLEW